jgi:uncharacterized damage-inducible protein DinB
MSHIYSMDTMWLNVMQERPFDESRALVIRLLGESGTESIEGMERRFKETELAYENFLQAAELERKIALAHPVYGSIQTPLSDVLQHVVNHGTYHRGNLTAMLRQQGHGGIPTDYMLYLMQSSTE